MPIQFIDRKDVKHVCAIPACARPIVGWIAIRGEGVKNFCAQHHAVILAQPDAGEKIIAFSYDDKGREEKTDGYES